MSHPEEAFALDGGCNCRSVRYRVAARPLVVHCCHCRWCQRESGSAFALNALIEASFVTHLAAEPEVVDTPSQSGMGQKIARCPRCRIAMWSNYSGGGPYLRFVRVGTLDTPDALPPDIHIYTASKQQWVVLPTGTPPFPNTTIASGTGRPRAAREGWRSCRRSRPIRRTSVVSGAVDDGVRSPVLFVVS